MQENRAQRIHSKVNNLEKNRQELKGSLLQEIIDWQARALSIAYENSLIHSINHVTTGLCKGSQSI